MTAVCMAQVLAEGLTADRIGISCTCTTYIKICIQQKALT